MKNLKPLFILMLVLLLGVITPQLSQAEPAGYLTIHKGIVKLTRNKKATIYKTPNQKIELINKDQIHTSIDTKATIFLKEQSEKVELFSNTYLDLKDVSPKRSSFFFPVGKARFIVQKFLNSRKKFQIKTATAVIGIKGTDFIVGASDTDTSILTLSGVVGLANVQMPNIEVNIGKSQASTVQKNTNPTVPVTVPPKVIEQVIKGDSSKDLKTIQYGAVTTAKKSNPKKQNKKPKEKQKSSEKKTEDKKEEKKSNAKNGTNTEEKKEDSPAASEPVSENDKENEEESSNVPAAQGPEQESKDSSPELGGDLLAKENIAVELGTPDIEVEDIPVVDESAIEEINTDDFSQDEILEDVEQIQDEIINDEQTQKAISISITH